MSEIWDAQLENNRLSSIIFDNLLKRIEVIEELLRDLEDLHTR